MAENLPQSGVELVAQNFDAFKRMMEAANKLIEDQGKKAAETAKKSNDAAGSAGKFDKGINNLIQRLAKGNPVIAKASQFLGDFGIQLSALPLGAVAAAAGIAALGVAFVALGHRGAELTGLALAFDQVSASVDQTSTVLLTRLREASAGTVSDFDLIRTANVALSGATGNLGKELGENLPRLLEIARTQAKVTGKDVDFLFNSIVEGIRKSSPLRIDNAGLIIKTGEAEQEYAASIGKTVEQLTTEEKGIAVLNATLEAGNAALEQAGNLQETNAEKIARSTATISNIFDTLALAVQPGFGAVQDGVNSILAAVENVVKKLAPFLNIIVTIIGTVIGKVLEAFGTIINVVLGLATPFLNGAQAVLGAFANGLLLAFNRVVFPIVLAIATAIADFLVGQSPPPKGPLSKIDEGGANTMTAWLQGFAGVGIQPIEDVMAEVATAMGNVAALGANAVAARIAVLDKALLPFQNRLDIVKANFEAIQAPAEAALNAIDRQIEAATEALARGEEGSAERVRALDAQRQMIQDAVAAQQAQVDAATVQLALVKAQQAQERALLNIRQAQLPVAQKTAKAKEDEAKAAKEKSPKGAAAEPAAAPTGGGAALGTPTPSVLGNFGADIAGFLNLNPDELAAFNQNTGAIGEQFGRLSDLGAATGGVAGGINKFGKLFDINDPTSPLGSIKAGIADLFNPDSPNSIGAIIGNFGNSLASSPVVQQVSDFFNSIFNPNVAGSAAAIVSDLVANLLSATSPDGILAAFRSFGSELANLPLVSDMLNFINSIFSPAILGSPAQILTDLVDSLVNPEREGSIPYFFATLPQRVSDAASSLFTQFNDQVIAPIREFLTGEGEGTLGGIINIAVGFFSTIPDRIVAALQNLGLFLWGAFAVPVINIMNAVIGIIESGVRAIQSTAELLVNNVAAAVGTAVALVPGGGGEAAGIEAAQNLKGGFGTIFQPVTFGRIPIEPPGFLTGAQTGGLFSGGLLKVGERGQELIGSASKLAVFPNEFVRAIDGLTQLLSGPVPVPVPATSSMVTNNNQRSINATFNGVQGPDDVMRRFASLQAFRG